MCFRISHHLFPIISRNSLWGITLIWRWNLWLCRATWVWEDNFSEVDCFWLGFWDYRMGGTCTHTLVWACSPGKKQFLVDCFAISKLLKTVQMAVREPFTDFRLEQSNQNPKIQEIYTWKPVYKNITVKNGESHQSALMLNPEGILTAFICS